MSTDEQVAAWQTCRLGQCRKLARCVSANGPCKVDQIEVIRQRWADASWPRIGWFVHGQALMDIRALLAEIDKLTAQRRSR